MTSPTMTVPIGMITQMLDRLGHPPGAASEAVARAGIAPALLARPSARVTVEQFAVFYRALVVQMDDETPGLFSRPLRGGTLKFLCLGLMGAPSLRVALHRFCCFFRLMLDDLAFRMTACEGVEGIVIEERRDLGAQRALILELMLLLIQGIASWMAERRLRFVRVDLAYPPPPHADEYLNMYAGPAVFGRPATMLVFEAGTLDLPVRQDKAAVSAFLRRAPTDWIRPPAGERLLTHRVRDLLEARLNRPPSIPEVARALHLSPRTLARRLDAEGTHFQAIKGAVRRDAAIVRLLCTDLPIATIGAQLGFEDPAAFNRAFRQWAGMPPGGYRKGRP